MSGSTTQAAIEDHALETVPAADRKSWLALSWSTAGIVTSLIQLFFGALVTFVAGFHIASRRTARLGLRPRRLPLGTVVHGALPALRFRP